jgi:hypothetical protein
MKKLLILGVVMLVAVSSYAEPHKKSFTTGTKGPKHGPSPSPPPITTRESDGVILRAVRGGNPLQMLNPKAPAKYGTAAQSVVFDPITGKWRGIKLFEIVF